MGGLDDLGSQSSDTSGKVKELQDALDDISEKLWELDKSWKNNLVFYGIKMDYGSDEHPSITEQKVSSNQIHPCHNSDLNILGYFRSLIYSKASLGTYVFY